MKISLVLHVMTSHFVEFEINNNMANTLWIGIQGTGGEKHLEDGGFILRPFGQRLVRATQNWTGIIWARTGCESNTKLCQTGSCGRMIRCSGAAPTPPVTTIDIALNAGKDGMDTYGVSLIDGFNVPAKIVPLTRHSDCMSSYCLFDINDRCHEELSLMSDAGVIGCHSSCSRYFSSCCRNKLNDKSCTNQSYPIESTTFFKENCPEVRNFIKDETNKEFLCRSQLYSISFGEKN